MTISSPAHFDMANSAINRYNTNLDANCIAHPDPPTDRPVGPCITSVLDLRDQENPLDGFVVEDCAVPQALSPLMFSMMEHLPMSRFPTSNIHETITKASNRIRGKVFGPYFAEGSIQKTAVYLIMSHDSKFRTFPLTSKLQKQWLI